MFDNELSVFVFKKDNHGNHDCKKKDQRRLDLLVHSFGQNGSNLALSISVVNPFLSSLSPHPKKLAAAELRESLLRTRSTSLTATRRTPCSTCLSWTHTEVSPQRTYLYVFKPPCEEDSRPCVLVNWAAPQHRDLLATMPFPLTLWKGNAYKVKYLADLYHIPCASSTSPVTCWTHTITLFFTVSSTSFFLLHVS